MKKLLTVLQKLGSVYLKNLRARVAMSFYTKRSITIEKYCINEEKRQGVRPFCAGSYEMRHKQPPEYDTILRSTK